jgi:hypothetical protein
LYTKEKAVVDVIAAVVAHISELLVRVQAFSVTVVSAAFPVPIDVLRVVAAEVVRDGVRCPTPSAMLIVVARACDGVGADAGAVLLFVATMYGGASCHTADTPRRLTWRPVADLEGTRIPWRWRRRRRQGWRRARRARWR